MRVLVVTRWFPDSHSPMSGVFNMRDCALLAQDHDVTVLHLGSSDPDARLGESLRVVRVPFRTKDIRPGSGLRPLLERMLGEADLLHTMAYPTLTAFLGLRVSIPWVHTEHYSLLIAKAPSWRAGLLMSAPMRRMLRRPDEVIAVGQELAAAVRRTGATSVSVIGNDVALPAADAPLPEALSALSPIRMIATGGLVANKGPLEAVRATALLRARGYDISLTWAGSGPLRDESEQTVRDLGIDEAVNFLGHVDAARIPDLLREHQLFILPTAYETFGVSIAEAIAQGLPVVTSGAGEYQTFLPSRGSRIVRERTPEALADAVDSLVRDENRLSSRELRTHAANEFSAAARRESYQDVYRKAAGSRVH
ncbi:glycosyltransferase family 4 protein [Microbacterium sp. Au-Mic1]|uniref:glycosyltransferase family 4 protein n=1 Tax=Microbacterium sp. Au-Mic1 TaxID=2906457 RepID=UPI001E36B3FA|nr:glycosyltransferase family 4 protein [Microbacterium sp. Au-Mic1]MCE4027329.1 glycosyltransferase family 4 protein [Microbacterium sp. Au-Mic1]